MSQEPNDMESSFSQPPAVRASDAERQATVELLNQALSEGRLNPDEHDDRVSRAQVASTHRALEALTADLRPIQDSHRADDLVPSNPAGAVVAHTYGTNKLSAILGDQKRAGAWSVPERLVVSAVMGSIKLDLREATFESPQVFINLQSIMSDVKLWIPDGVEVVDEATNVMSDTKYKGVTPARPGMPRLVISGFQFMSEIIVYGSGHVSLGDRIKGNF